MAEIVSGAEGRRQNQELIGRLRGVQTLEQEKHQNFIFVLASLKESVGAILMHRMRKAHARKMRAITSYGRFITRRNLTTPDLQWIFSGEIFLTHFLDKTGRVFNGQKPLWSPTPALKQFLLSKGYGCSPSFMIQDL